MGRTNPTFRDALRSVEEEWRSFRRALRGRHQSDFDRLLEGAEQFADAAGYQNAIRPREAIVLAMLLAHEVRQRELEERIAALEEASSETRETE